VLELPVVDDAPAPALVVLAVLPPWEHEAATNSAPAVHRRFMRLGMPCLARAVEADGQRSRATTWNTPFCWVAPISLHIHDVDARAARSAHPLRENT
jgi:hypothetical protein